MSGSYGSFAFYYDILTQNVNYQERANYICTLLSKLGHGAGLTLDLACGTGSLTIELCKHGLDIYGIDASMEMLSVARQKASEQNLDILFLCQKMQKLDLYGTVDTVVCALDSVNHLTLERDVISAFQRISLFLNPGGYFIFDMNTIYKHKYILGDHVFIYDTEPVYCVWQNQYSEKNHRVSIMLDFFERDGSVYRRNSERFYERAYSVEQMESWLGQSGLKLKAIYDDMTFEVPKEKSERLILVAEKQ